MTDKEIKKIYTFELTELQAGLLTAAVCDLFHKIRASMEDPNIDWLEDDRYQEALDLWNLVDEQTEVSKWGQEKKKGEGVELKEATAYNRTSP